MISTIWMIFTLFLVLFVIITIAYSFTSDLSVWRWFEDRELITQSLILSVSAGVFGFLLFSPYAAMWLGYFVGFFFFSYMLGVFVWFSVDLWQDRIRRER